MNKIVDHINRNKMDNRRENLRICTTLLNNQNKSICKNKKSSIYRGVFYNKTEKKYKARLKYKKNYISIGTFQNELDAVTAFDMYVVHNNLEGIELNFPNKKEEYKNQEYKSCKRVTTNKYIGVTYIKKLNKYLSRINYNKKDINILYSENEIDCAKAYDKYIVDNNIPQKKLNFPNDYPNYNKNSIIKTKYESIDENTIKLLINNIYNDIIKIDKDDYDKIKYFTWNCNRNGYVSANINGETKSLYRYILNITDPTIYIDHIDSDPKNNTKKNLRISDKYKNPQNRKKGNNTTSKFKGVCFDKSKKNWMSRVGRKFIGRNKNEEYAARMRDIYISENLSDSHYKLNFEWTPENIKEWKQILNL